MAEDKILASLSESMIALQGDKTQDLVQQALAQKIAPFAIMNCLSDAMKRIGERFASGDCFIPELILSGRTFQQAMMLLEPVLQGAKTARARGKVVLGTVKGDLHDLGVKLVALTLSADGFDVVNLGSDVSAETFVDEVREQRPQILGLSALLTTTLHQQQAVIESLQGSNLRHEVKVMVGGAPVTQAWANTIGADAVGFDAIDALEKARALLGQPKGAERSGNLVCARRYRA